jgi:hypothetical protein
VRTFVLHRVEDVSGVSGEGIVAEGVQFSDGHCTLRWLTKDSSTAIYDSIEALERIHGHDGSTHIVWLTKEHNVSIQLKRVLARLAASTGS